MEVINGAGDVFPRRNLPPEAEQWGRKVEDRIVSGENSEVQLSQVVNNMGRSTAGQLAVLSNQLTELSSFRTWRQDVPDFSLTVPGSGSTFNTWYSGGRTLSFPAPEGGSRSAILTLTATLSANVSSGQLVSVSGVKYLGSYLFKSPGAYLGTSAGQSVPPGWLPSTGIVSTVLVPAGVTPSFEFEVQGSAAGTGSFTIDVTNISGILQYGDRA